MALSDQHVASVCNYNYNDFSKTCKFLSNTTDQKGHMVSVCSKLSKSGRVLFPKNKAVNCSGYLPLTEIKQGYDIDGIN